MNKTSLTVTGALVVGSALVALTGCGDTEPSVKEKSVAWWSTVSPEMDSLQNHLTALSSVSGSTSYEDMTSYCQDLVTDVNSLKAEDPFPKDPETWDKVLNLYGQAFNACVAGDYGDTLTYGEKANTEMEKVVQEAESLHINP